MRLTVRSAARLTGQLTARLAAAAVILIILGQALDRLVTSSIAASPARISINAPPMAPITPVGRSRDDAAPADAPFAPLMTSTSSSPPATSSSASSSARSPSYVMTTTLRHNESVQDMLQRLRVDGGPSLSRLLERDSRTRTLRLLQAGNELQIRYDDQRRLTALVADLDDRRRTDGKRRIAISRGADGRLGVSDAFRPHDIYWRLRSGRMQPGFFSSMAASGVPGQVVAEAMRIFRGRIDFRQDFQAGDAFHIIYQQAMDTTRPAGVGRILAIALQAGGRWHRAVWHEPPGADRQASGQGDYFAFDGRRLRTSTWIAPIGNAPVSSAFGTRRHPISGHHHRHDGIDLVAPVGTPVLASATGIVESAGWQRGYGRVVVLRHAPPYSTYYAHLSSIAPSIRAGAKVAQGQWVGAVGRTGDTTGAHLHFELRTRNRPIDPLLALQDSRPLLSDEQLAAFRASSAPLVKQITRMQASTATLQTNGVTNTADATTPHATVAPGARTAGVTQPRPS